MTWLRRVARNVADLATAAKFYSVLGFVAVGPAGEDAALAAALEVDRAFTQRMALGAQQLELTQCVPQGAAYPAAATSSDICFQHIAIVTRDIFAMTERALAAGAKPISWHGPQQLPAASGGVIAWKFRDAEGHPLELLQLPEGGAPGAGQLTSGYDHSAICVSDVARSIRFYEALGLSVQHRHLNRGPEQARLDGRETSVVEVVALASTPVPPHVELLAYAGAGASRYPTKPHDIAADRLVFSHAGTGPVLRRDPDGYLLLLGARD